jgi:hypothetical protein
MNMPMKKNKVNFGSHFTIVENRVVDNVGEYTHKIIYNKTNLDVAFGPEKQMIHLAQDLYLYGAYDLFSIFEPQGDMK